MRAVDLDDPKPKLERVSTGDKHCCHVFVVNVQGDTDTMKCKYCPALRLVHYKMPKFLARGVKLNRMF